ncbi:hypothetical protein pb186bvf_012472 [Paramecium bursaria]
METNVSMDKLIKDCDGLIRKNGLRKVVIMLDRQYLQLQQLGKVAPYLSYRVARRLIVAGQLLIQQYITNEQWARITLEQLLERINIYLTCQYIAIFQILHNDRDFPQDDISFLLQTSPSQRNNISLQRLRVKLHDQILIQQNYLLKMEMPKNQKLVSFYLQEFWHLLLEQLKLWYKIFKCSNDFQGCIKSLSHFKQIIDQSEFKNTKDPVILKMIIQYYYIYGQLHFQICEFKSAAKSYKRSITFLQKLITIILKQNQCPSVMEEKDIQIVRPQFFEIALSFYLMSFCYEYMSNYSKMKESIKEGLWILLEVLRATEDNQLLILLRNRQSEFINKYEVFLMEEFEIVRALDQVFGKQEKQLNSQTNITVDFMTTINNKYYNQFQINNLNQQQFIKFHEQNQGQQPKTPYLNLVHLEHKYSQPKSNTPRQVKSDHFTLSKHMQSSTTFDNDLDISKKMLTTESEVKKLKMNTQKPLYNQQEEKQKAKIIPKANYQNFCSSKRSDYPKLESELGSLITRTLQNESTTHFFDLQEVSKTIKDEQQVLISENRDIKLGKSIINFKRQFSKAGLIDKFVPQTVGELRQDVKLEYQQFQTCFDVEEELKKKKNYLLQQQKLKQQEHDKANKFRRIMLKHATTLGIKKLKKKLLKKHLAQAIDNMALAPKHEETPVQINHEVKLKQTIATNLNVIKLLMDENQSEQDDAMKQLRNRHLSYDRLKSNTTSHLKHRNQHVKTITYQSDYNDLAQTTQYLSARGDASKKIMSIAELTSIKRKMNQLENKKLNRKIFLDGR